MTIKNFKIRRQMAEYSFLDLCKEIEVTVQDGMRLFLHTNVYLDKYVAMDIPFIGHGLHKHPYHFVAPQLPPEQIRLNLETKQEIIRRTKLMSPHLKCILKNRFSNRKQNKVRTRLRAYLGMRDEFIGTISAFKVPDPDNPYLVKVCVENVAFAKMPNDVLTDHTWVLVLTSMITSKQLTIGDTFEFRGTPVEYKRPNPETYGDFIDDVCIRVEF